MNVGKLGLPIVLQLLLLLPGSSAAQDSYCDRGLVDRARGNAGYAQRGDRCEGLYVQEVAGTALFLASFVERFDDFDARSGDPLVVGWTAPDAAPVRIRARGVKRDLYYQMDTIGPRGSTSYSWSTDLLASLRLGRPDIGVLGWTEHTIGNVARELYLPLRIGERDAEAGTAAYTLLIFPNVQLDEVYVSLGLVGADGQVGDWLIEDEPLAHGFYPAERPVDLTVPQVDLSGVYEVRIRAMTSGDPIVLPPVWIYHAGN